MLSAAVIPSSPSSLGPSLGPMTNAVIPPPPGPTGPSSTVTDSFAQSTETKQKQIKFHVKQHTRPTQLSVEYDETNYILRNFSFVIPNKLAGCHRPGMSPSNLLNDLKVLHAQGISQIVSLSECDLDSTLVTQQGFKHVSFEVADYCPPSIEQMEAMVTFVDSSTHGATVIHCNAGMGRTGTMLAAYLIAHQMYTAEKAIKKLRKLRKGSIQTFKQEDGLRAYEQWLLDKRQAKETEEHKS